MEGDMILEGKVTFGLGEGKYYICLEGYRRQFKEKLGFEPYPGTLNLKLEEPLDLLDARAIEIEGFQQEGCSFGGGRCYPCLVQGMRCAIIRPNRSSHPMSLIEIIAPVNLRRWLNLRDGDDVELVV